MFFWLWVILVLGLDQISKWAMVVYLSSVDGHVVSLGIFDLRLVYNKGAAFGMLQGHREIFIGVALAALSAAIFYLYKYSPDLKMKVIIGLITGGALGNLVDRVLYGYVIDFIDFGWWPVFNLADSAIVVGATLLAVMLLLNKNPTEGNAYE